VLLSIWASKRDAGVSKPRGLSDLGLGETKGNQPKYENGKKSKKKKYGDANKDGTVLSLTNPIPSSPLQVPSSTSHFRIELQLHSGSMRVRTNDFNNLRGRITLRYLQLYILSQTIFQFKYVLFDRGLDACHHFLHNYGIVLEKKNVIR
jgi:hypothetical protein